MKCKFLTWGVHLAVKDAGSTDLSLWFDSITPHNRFVVDNQRKVE